jgi:hypothetical protein
MLPNLPKADIAIGAQRPDERSHDDLDSIIAHYGRISPAEKKLARTKDHASTEHQDNDPPTVLHSPYSPTD